MFVISFVMNEKFFVYQIFNVKNGKRYVGQTKNLSKRWSDHKYIISKENHKDHQLIHNAMNKYGIHNFEFSKIQELNSLQEVLAAEKYWIEFYKTNKYKYGNEFGYNLTDGGEGTVGRKLSDDHKRKIGEAHKGKIVSEYTRKLLSEKNKGQGLGRKIPRDVVEKTTSKIRGRKNSEKTLKLQSEIKMGDKNPMFGKRLSQEEKLYRRKNRIGTFKLTDDNVKEIRKLISDGMKLNAIASLFNVNASVISRIKTGKTWYWIE